MRISIMKRSNCASGSGYVPSCSIGILRGGHQERLLQRIGLAAHGDVPLGHRLQQRRLRLRRRAVDFVGQHEVGEHRTGPKRHRRPLAVLAAAEQLVAGHVGGHQVGRKLDAAVLPAKRGGQGLDHQRLGQARHAHDQGVGAGQRTDQQLVDHLVLADDDFVQGGADRPDAIGERADLLLAQIRLTGADCHVAAPRFQVPGMAWPERGTWSNVPPMANGIARKGGKSSTNWTCPLFPRSSFRNGRGRKKSVRP